MPVIWSTELNASGSSFMFPCFGLMDIITNGKGKHRYTWVYIAQIQICYRRCWFIMFLYKEKKGLGCTFLPAYL